MFTCCRESLRAVKDSLEFETEDSIDFNLGCDSFGSESCLGGLPLMELYEDLGVLFDESSENTWFGNRWIATGSGTGLGTLMMTITLSQLVRKIGFYYYSESELTIRVTAAAGDRLLGGI